MSDNLATKLNTRTHPILKETTNLNSVNLGITTRCTMHCPNCSIGVPALQSNKKDKDAPIAQIAQTGLIMSDFGKHPLRRVHITGGEPTVHKWFQYIADEMHGWFVNTKYWTIETNGAFFRKYKETLRDRFDLVFITHYQKDTIYPNNFDNTEIIKEAKDWLGDKLIVEQPVKHDRKHRELLKLSVREEINRAEEEACTKWFDPGLPCAWYDGKLYPCCVSVGISSELAIPVAQDWRQKVATANKGCFSCLYRGT